VLPLNKNLITLESELENLFPRNNRIKELESELGTPIDILDTKAWLGWHPTFYVFLQMATCTSRSFGFHPSGLDGNKFFAKELEIKTIRQLTEKLARGNYVDVRRKRGIIDREDILKIMIDTFSNDLNIDKAFLTRNDKFSWSL
jgi:hypothetical protein